MKFDTIIIGGGLSGLLCGLRLQKAGQKCAIVSSGQNAMHFFSGGFGLLSRLPDGTLVDKPLDSIEKLPASHPYAKIGKEKITKYTEDIFEMFGEYGINVTGNAEKNGYLISATGSLKPAWLTLDDMTYLKEKDEKIGNKALIINIEAFLDFCTSFIAESLEKRGTQCRIVAVTTDEMNTLRKNPSEMRSSNIAKLMSDDTARAKLIDEIKKQIKDEDTIVLPAVFGLKADADVADIREQLPVKVCFVGTLPPSVPGIRTQMKLKRAFEEAGGVFLMGDKALTAKIENNKVIEVSTENLGEINLTADNYVLASGSYFGHGLMTDRDKVTEPVLGLDVDFPTDRNEWFDKNFFKEQKYIGFGVDTDEKFRGRKNGQTIENLYVAGSALGGFNPLHEGCGSGVAIMTAINISESILSR